MSDFPFQAYPRLFRTCRTSALIPWRLINPEQCDSTNPWDDSRVPLGFFDWNDSVITWAPAQRHGGTRTSIARTEMPPWLYWTEMERTGCWESTWWGISSVSISYSCLVSDYNAVQLRLNSTELDSKIGAVDRRNFQLATDGLGMGCDGWEDGFSEFRKNGTREIWEVRVALYHNGSRIEVQVEREKLRRTEALYMRSARRSFR